MTFKAPSIADLERVADRLGLALSADDLEAMRTVMAPMAGGYRTLDGLIEPLPVVKYARTPGYRPDPAENKYGAWYVKTAIKGAAAGPLKGKRVGIKDNICVAGVPMMNGASIMEGFVPDIDATVVSRILDAGGEIAGKTVCEYLCTSGGSHTASTGAVANPRKPTHTAGGSSSGSAAVVAAGDVPMALGCDQAGSVRQPAAHCGIVGMKATWGLVPYSGIMSVETTLDHVGPMTATVADNALLLEVLAGPDGLDGRQAGAKVERYTKALGQSVTGLKVGVVKEGFEQWNSEADVNRVVKKAIAQLKKLGIAAEEVSIPWHKSALAIWAPICNEGMIVNLLHMGGAAINPEDLSSASVAAAFARWKTMPNDLADTFKIIAMFGTYAVEAYGGHYYGKAQNLRRSLRAAYDDALGRYDLLAMPTMALKGKPLPTKLLSLAENAEYAFVYIANPCAFNVTGHPAMSIPAGTIDDLPIGLSLIAKHWDEATLYRAAHAYEQGWDWRKNAF